LASPKLESKSRDYIYAKTKHMVFDQAASCDWDIHSKFRKNTVGTITFLVFSLHYTSVHKCAVM